MARFEIHDQMGMMDLIQEIGFLPLLDSGIRGFSAEEMSHVPPVAHGTSGMGLPYTL